MRWVFFPHFIFYIQEILINKILDFLPLKVIHDVKYSCWRPQFFGKTERNKILVFTKVSLTGFFLSCNFLKFILVFGLTNSTVQISKLEKSEFKFSWEFSMCVMYVKTFAGVPDHICSFCNCWTLLTFSQISVGVILMYQLANTIKHLTGCWISHDFTFKNVFIWFVISRTCEFRLSFRFSLFFIHFSKFL